MMSVGNFLVLSFWVLLASLIVPWWTPTTLHQPHPQSTSKTSAKSAPPINFNDVLLGAGRYPIFRTMLTASTVAIEIMDEAVGAGSTLLVPSDTAFTLLADDLNSKLQSLPATEKSAVLKFHVLDAYYPLMILRSIINPEQPTLATQSIGAGNFTVSISKVNHNYVIESGVTIARVTQTIYDRNPFAIYGISSVLLPPEIFEGKSKQ